MACGTCASNRNAKEEFLVFDKGGNQIATKTTQIEAKAAAARAGGTWKRK